MAVSVRCSGMCVRYVQITRSGHPGEALPPLESSNDVDCSGGDGGDHGRGAVGGWVQLYGPRRGDLPRERAILREREHRPGSCCSASLRGAVGSDGLLHHPAGMRNFRKLLTPLFNSGNSRRSLRADCSTIGRCMVTTTGCWCWPAIGPSFSSVPRHSSKVSSSLEPAQPTARPALLVHVGRSRGFIDRRPTTPARTPRAR